MTPYNLLGITGTPKIFTVDTTAPTTYAAVGGGATSTSSAVKLQWYGSYSYVAISQSVNGGAYVDLSAVVVSTPYTVSDVSGNTALSYKITPYYSGVAGTAASVITVNTNVQAPRDVSAVYVDSSGALISFTAPKNTYSSDAVYTLRATDVSSGTYKDVSGTASPLWITILSGGTTYTVVAKTTLDGSASLVSTSSAVSFITSSVITDVSFINDVSGLFLYYPINSDTDISNISAFNYVTNSYDASYNTITDVSNTKYKTGTASLTGSFTNNSTYYTFGNYTIAFWLNPSSYTSTASQLYLCSLTEFNQIWITNGVMAIYTFNGSAYSFGNTVQSLNTWTHYTIVCLTNNTAKLYINGANPITISTGGTNYGSSRFRVGMFYPASTGTTYMDDIRAYNVALDATTIQGIYNIGNSSAKVVSASYTSTSTTITVNWTGSNAVSYALQNYTTKTIYKNITDSTYTITGVTPGAYSFYVHPYDSGGNQGQSSYIVNTVMPTFYYKFNSGDISNNLVYNYANLTYDASLSSYSGAAVSSISTSIFARGSGSMQFTRTNKQQMRLPGSFYMSSTVGISISFWMYEGGNSPYARLYNFMNNTTEYYSLYVNGGYKINNNAILFSTPTLNTWTHIVITHTISNTIIVYVNGVQSTTLSFNYPSTTVLLNYNWLSRGHDSDAAANYGFYNGCIDNFKFYNGIVLTAAQVATVYSEDSTVINSVPGLQLWLDASATSSLVLSDSSVTTWNDQSGYARNTTLSIGSTPTYSATGFNSKPGVLFASGTALTCSIPSTTFSSAMTIFVVFQKTGTANTYETLVTRSASTQGAPFEMWMNARNVNGSVATTSGLNIATATGYNIFNVIITPTTYNEWNNGTSIVSTTLGFSSLNDTGTFYIGTRGDKTTLFTGTFAEIIVYNTALSTTNRNAVKTYLSNKWGITVA
jgi:hypothetical protein